MKHTDIQMVGRGRAGHCPKCGSSEVRFMHLTCLIEIAPHQFSPKVVCQKCGKEYVEDTRLTPDFLLEADRELYRRLEEMRNEKVDRVIEKALTDLYAVRGEPSREHILHFYGTPDEFAFFKARLCEWAKKRILT